MTVLLSPMGAVTIKILLITQYFPPEMGALASRSLAHATEWAKAGHYVRVVCGTPNFPDGKIYSGFKNRPWQVSTMAGIHVIRVWVWPLPNRKGWERMLNYLSFFCSSTIAGVFGPRPDVVLATSPQLLVGLAGYIVSRLRRVPFVFEVRDLWPETLIAVGPARCSILFRLLRLLGGFLYRRADKLVVVSRAFRGVLCRDYGVDRKRLVYVPNGVDPDAFDPQGYDVDDVRRNLAIPKPSIVVSYTGTIGMCQGIGTILEAAQLTKDSRLVFLLVGDGAEREVLEERARIDGLSGVRFLGRRPREEIPQILAASDIVLVLLRGEPIFRTAIPSKMFEAMAMAKPLILSAEGEARRLANRAGGCLVITPDCPQELAEAVDTLAADRTIRVTMGESSRVYVLRTHTREASASHLLNVLIRVVGAARSSHFQGHGVR